ncbi:response regulator [Paenibacillus sp. LMG 31460]|uniref:Response regulator n=1 Tax=Paenibacillus germinis TaxID=2654979 RepID=A0ABX1YX56_9BACL|nr:response regulator [Paenibacillus germinis]NOU85712.1 response regulator [Paenibacillus germinis]
MKVMVIEDEPIVINGLKVLIPWEEYGFEWLPPAENGLKALEQMEVNQPNLILVDCQMPTMGGLALLTEIRNRKWPIKSIILSGHDEFDYVRQALQLGATDYLLKPPDTDMLFDVLRKLKTEWEEDNERNRQLQENMPLIRDRFLRSLLEGARLNEKLFMEKTAYLMVPLTLQPFRIVLLQIEQDPEILRNYNYEDQQLMNFAIQNIAEETLQCWGNKCIFLELSDRFAIIVNMTFSMEELHRDLRLLVANIRQTLKYFVTIGIGALCEQLVFDGKMAYEQAKTALEYKYYTGPNEVIFIDDVDWETSKGKRKNDGMEPPMMESSTIEDTSSAYVRLRMALKIGNLQELEAWMQVFFNDLQEKEITIPLTKTESLQAMITGASVISDLHPKLKLNHLLTAEQIQLVLSAATLEELSQICKTFLRYLLQLTIDLRKSGRNNVVEAAKAMLETKYASNLSLDTIAKEVFVSPVYLSFLFKQVEGVNLTDYVTHVRMDKAKELLLGSNLKTYEIANRVGYQDEKYFSRLFKKRIGMTPTEFRQ